MTDLRDPESSNLFDYAVAQLEIAASQRAVPCKICGGSSPAFDMVDFNKACHNPAYPLGLSFKPVVYRRCEDCHFIFTNFFDGFTDLQWRSYVYNQDYLTVDPQYAVARPNVVSKQISSFLLGRKSTVVGLDYGGGNGKTVALLRNAGWRFDCFDPFAHTDIRETHKKLYNFCSAMEVFEHTPSPTETLDAIVDLCSSDRLTIFFSTLVHDDFVSNRTRLSWWYAAPRNGHISLYSRRSLQILGERSGLTYLTLARGSHLFIRNEGTRRAQGRFLVGKIIAKMRTKLSR